MADDLTPEEMLYPNGVGQIKAEVVWPARRFVTCVKLAKEALRGLIPLGYAEATDRTLTEEPGRKKFAIRWTAYLAYRGRLQQMGGIPGTIEARDEGSSKFDPDQRALVAKLMNDELAAAEDIVTGAVTFLGPRTSRSVRADIELV